MLAFGMMNISFNNLVPTIDNNEERFFLQLSNNDVHYVDLSGSDGKLKHWYLTMAHFLIWRVDKGNTGTFVDIGDAYSYNDVNTTRSTRMIATPPVTSTDVADHYFLVVQRQTTSNPVIMGTSLNHSWHADWPSVAAQSHGALPIPIMTGSNARHTLSLAADATTYTADLSGTNTEPTYWRLTSSNRAFWQINRGPTTPIPWYPHGFVNSGNPVTIRVPGSSDPLDAATHYHLIVMRWASAQQYVAAVRIG